MSIVFSSKHQRLDSDGKCWRFLRWGWKILRCERIVCERLLYRWSRLRAECAEPVELMPNMHRIEPNRVDERFQWRNLRRGGELLQREWIVCEWLLNRWNRLRAGCAKPIEPMPNMRSIEPNRVDERSRRSNLRRAWRILQRRIVC